MIESGRHSTGWLAILVTCLLAIWSGVSPGAAAEDEEASPIAVLRSEKNQATYSEQHIGEFDDDWTSFKQTFETVNVRYLPIKDSQLRAGSAELARFKVIVVPLLVDLPPEAVPTLKEFVERGGKLIVTDGCGQPSRTAQEVIALAAGAEVTGHSTLQESKQLVWPREPFPLTQDFAVGTLRADLAATDPANVVASWRDAQGREAGIAVAGRGGSAFITWAPGLQGDLTGNAQLLSVVLEEASPGISQKAAVQISYADYQTIQQELDYLQKRTDEVIKTAKQADLAVPFKAIQANYDAATAHVQNFLEAYKQRRFYEASEQVSRARHEFALAFAKAMPVRPVETRAVWLDRGTIISTKNAKGMTELIEKLKSAGINCIYFETNNAGFTMYPSKLAMQNPQLEGWDAFGTALTEAHKRGMEFHAWIWVFNVGNERHNPIIGKETDYPGPVLSARSFSWALSGKDGSLLARNQHEYWIDPANPDGRNYCKTLLKEIVERYPVDGIQYDYIRYPFNAKPNQMGFNWVGRLRFERETGLTLDSLDEEGSIVFQAWRIAQVNSFVEETSAMLRKLRPNIRLSAAVYGFPRRLRCWNVQQDWETWVSKGWIDTVNPMTYVATAKDLKIMANNVRESSQDQALVLPGLSIRQLDTAGFVEQLDTSRDIGTLGTTLFAVAQLDDKKLELLKIGPYRRPAVMTAQSDPVRATILLYDDFLGTVNRYLQDPKKRVISDTASTNQVLKEMEELNREIHSLSSESEPEQLAAVREHILSLHQLVKDWLRIDAFAQRGFRAQYIISYLDQIESILNYAEHKRLTHPASSIAGGAISRVGLASDQRD